MMWRGKPVCELTLEELDQALEQTLMTRLETHRKAASARKTIKAYRTPEWIVAQQQAHIATLEAECRTRAAQVAENPPATHKT